VWRLPIAIFVCALGLATPALGSASHAPLWTALGGDITCGVAIHAPGSPASQVLCSAKPVPAPKAKGIGDPGFVFLASTGHPLLARLSQDSFVGSSPVALENGSTWTSSPIRVTCSISASAVRCTNHAHHGFTITKSSYRAF
jgi:hypothetical protein